MNILRSVRRKERGFQTAGISGHGAAFSASCSPDARISAGHMRSMGDDSLEKQQKQRGRPFIKGQSGNPAGRPRGARNGATRAMQLLLDGEAQALTRKAVELALDGDTTALRMCLDRIAPPRRERGAPFKLPPVRDALDLAGAMTAIIAATGNGAI